MKQKKVKPNPKKMMNAPQKIMLLLFKMFYYDEYEDSLKGNEKRFCLALKEKFDRKGLRYDYTFGGKLILSWHSSCDRTIACYVSKNGFVFSAPEVYKSSTRNMKGPVKTYFHLGDTRHEMVRNEIEEIKKIFSAYAPEVKKYFT